MPEIILTTLNAKYIHAAFGLRYLLANLGPLRPRAGLMEFDIHQRPVDIAEKLLAQNPAIIGLGIYIWNVAPSTELVATLKRVRPDLVVILGGPEVSYEVEVQPIVQLADYVITGEADLKFAEICDQLLAGQRPARKVIPADLPDLSRLTLPYALYADQDIAHRIVYLEASRGCPFTCEFCLSSLDIPVRQVPLPALLDQLDRLFQRGLTHFKFVDRTFNLNLQVSRTILEFLLERCRPGHLFHFELVPDRLPQSLRTTIAKFPPGALQFEVGIQTFNETVGALIRRRQNHARLEENLRFLRRHTGAHLHADLIAGLPGESLESFAAGFDRLVALGPHEIQVGILKRLRGTPIVRHDAEWQMVYNPHAPYEILQNKLLDFATLQKLRRFARFWDLVGNSGNFLETTPLLLNSGAPTGGHTCASAPASAHSGGASDRLSFVASSVTRDSNSIQSPPPPSPFHAFLRWSEWAYARLGRSDSIALARLMELLFEYLTRERNLGKPLVAQTLWRDYQRAGRSDKPAFLREFLADEAPHPSVPRKAASALKRQARHAAALAQPPSEVRLL